MYVPGSHRFGKKPQQVNSQPLVPALQRQLVAPAGSVFMYHAATWHRMHPNFSASPRLGLLQSFVPDFTNPRHAVRRASNAGPAELVRASHSGGLSIVFSNQPRSQDARNRLAGWLREVVEPKMAKSWSFASNGLSLQMLTRRERTECAQMWLGVEHSAKL